MTPRPARRASDADRHDTGAARRPDGLRGLPFPQAFRVARTRAPGSWNSVTTGLSAVAALFLVHTWLLVSQGNPPSVVGVVMLPLGGVLVTYGWVYDRVLVMMLGIVVAFFGVAGPFWVMNAT